MIYFMFLQVAHVSPACRATRGSWPCWGGVKFHTMPLISRDFRWIAAVCLTPLSLSVHSLQTGCPTSDRDHSAHIARVMPLLWWRDAHHRDLSAQPETAIPRTSQKGRRVTERRVMKQEAFPELHRVQGQYGFG